MTYSKYPSPMTLLHVPSSSGVLGLGGFVLEDGIALERVIIYLAKFGAAGGSETLTAKIFGNSDLTAPIASSSAVALAGLQAMATDWAGWASFEFPTLPPIAAGQTYYLGLTSASYTANGTTFFIAVQADSHAPFNKPAWGVPAEIAKFRIEGKRQWPE